MKELILFLRNFNKRSITIEDLSKELGRSVDEVSDLLLKARKRDFKELEWFSIKYDYYLGGVKTEDTFAHLKEGVERKPVSLHNRYYQDSRTKGNILLTQLVQGEPVFKGQVDESDIGGLYTSCYTLHDEYGSRIIDYSSLLLDDLLSIFKEEFQINYNNGEKKVSIPNRGIESTSNDFFGAFIGVIQELAKQEEFFVVQVKEEYDGELSESFNYSQVFYSEKDAQAWVDSQDKDSESLRYHIVNTTKYFQ